MISILLVIHVLLSLSIIGLVLLQRGKGAEAGASLGGGSSGSVFGARGAANFLSRSTAVLATAFFITSLGLAYLSSNMQPGVNELEGPGTALTVDMPDTDIPAPLQTPDSREVPVGDVPGSDAPSSDVPVTE
ncbi:Protein translocase membrane subunit SecG [hydrothermal vent metagenome]|uniref:Protein translocase membrane subunit SecG n=1 Tax=hydrothermal vent metagenome TaxID=652676 RepID=A0A3B0Y6F3_9ZZZZ